MEDSDNRPSRIAVKLTADAERILKQQRHPWIFSNSIASLKKEGKAGDLAIIFDRKNNQVIGIGLYDPESPVRIKMLHFGESATIDGDFFNKIIQSAIEIRKPLLETDTTAYRLIFGENDGLPGLIADVYNNVLVVKLYSAIWAPYLPVIYPFLQLASKTDTVVVRLSRQLESLPYFPYADGEVLTGDVHSGEVLFKEYGVLFSANVLKGHKTGFFLDHRHNRKRVGEYAFQKTVLDVFSYAGGFSVHALAGGARQVTSVDMSGQALEIARKNGALNTVPGVHETIQGDAFEILKKLISEKKTYDLVVIDPPSFAKSSTEIAGALRKYQQLARLGDTLTAPGGLLILASCSSRISPQEFFSLIEQELKKSTSTYEEVLKTGHDTDHSVTFKEGQYLKCGYYRKISR